MIDPRKPIIDPRTTVRGNEDTKATPVSAAPAQQSDAAPASSATPAADSSSSTSATTVSASAAPATTVPERYTASSYAELIPQLERRMKELEPLSKEQLEKIRRRQKVEGIISGISDAARAVSNLIFTHRYAPDMYDAKNSMSVKARERFDREKADRDARDDKYFNYALMLGKLRDADKARGLQAWNMEQTLARKDRDFVLKQGENEAKIEKLKAEVDAAIKRGDLAEAEKKLKEAQKIKVEEDTKWIAPVKESEIARNNAAANASNANANESNVKTDQFKKSGGRKPYGTFLGTTYYSKPDYDKAVEDAGRAYHVANDKKETSDNGGIIRTRTVKKTTPEKAAEIEEINRKRRSGSNSAKSRTDDKKTSNPTGAERKSWSNTSKIKWK